MRVIPALPDSLPGYEGDARIFWETARLHNQQEAVEVTLSGLKVLRDFWVSGKEGSEEARMYEERGERREEMI